MQFVAGSVGRKLPGDGTALAIAPQFNLVDARAQLPHAFHSARQARTLENADLDLGHVQPTAVFWGVVELHALQDAPGFLWRKGFIERSRDMSIEIILSCLN
jgi:hypothetical protein